MYEVNEEGTVHIVFFYRVLETNRKYCNLKINGQFDHLGFFIPIGIYILHYFAHVGYHSRYISEIHHICCFAHKISTAYYKQNKQAYDQIVLSTSGSSR